MAKKKPRSKKKKVDDLLSNFASELMNETISEDNVSDLFSKPPILTDQSVSTSEAPESSLKGLSSNPSPTLKKTNKANKRALPATIVVTGHKESNSNDTSSQTNSEQYANSRRTISEQFEYNTDIVREQKANNTETVSEQYANSSNTDQVQYANNQQTKNEQYANSRRTISEQFEYNTDIVREQKANNTETVSEQYANSGNTDQVQYANNQQTKNEQYRNSKGTKGEPFANSTQINEQQNTNNKQTYTRTVRLQYTNPDYAGTLSVKETFELLKTLHGTRGELVEYLCNQCISSSLNVLDRVTYQHIAEVLGKNKQSLRTIALRVKKLKIIDIEAITKGPGSTINIIVFDNTLKAFSQLILERSTYQKIREQNTNNKQTNTLTPPSSSSNNLTENKKTITKELSEEWRGIVTPQSVKEIGFGLVQIKQLHNLENLNPEIVQKSLDAFAYDLDDGVVKSKGSKLGFFMGIMRNGGEYVSEALTAEMAEFVEANNRRKQQRAELEKKVKEDELSKKAQEEFEKLSDDKKLELADENAVAKLGSFSHNQMVLQALKEKILNKN